MGHQRAREGSLVATILVRRRPPAAAAPIVAAELPRAGSAEWVELDAAAAEFGVAAALNAHFARLSLPYVLVLDAGVRAGEHALSRLAAALDARPEAAAVGPLFRDIAGEQCLERHLPGRAPESDAALAAALAARFPEPLLSIPALSGECILLRREAVLAAGGFDERFVDDGSEIELCLRLAAKGAPVLLARDACVGRAEPGGSATESLLRRAAAAAEGAQLLAEAVPLAVGAGESGQLPGPRPLRGRTSVVIPVLDNLEITRECLTALYRCTRGDLEVIVVDNGSTEDVGSLARGTASAWPNLRVLRNPQNEGFAFAVNQGLAAATGEFIAVLNNDVVVTDGWLARLLAVLSLDPRIAAVGPRSNRVSGPQQVAAADYDGIEELAAFARRFAAKHAGSFALIPRVVALCAVYRRSALAEVGGFDTGYWLGNFEDDDLCLRLVRRGYRLAVAGSAFVHHHGSATFRAARLDYRRLMQDNWRYFCHKWGHRGTLGERYPALELARALPFDSARDFVPPRYEDAFFPEATPLPLEGARERRLLLIAEAGEAAWCGILEHYLREVDADAPITLVLRIEPPAEDAVASAAARIEEVVRRCSGPGRELPDVLLEATPIAPRARGGLYTAASALISCDSARAALWRREAEACGLAVATSAEAFAAAPTSTRG